ncbi:hypothetical protein HDU83_006648 [Entophlyctis luteolus]|nr:hypothetical protein HDU83_006648 [Entophlyctis luteolus]
MQNAPAVGVRLPKPFCDNGADGIRAYIEALCALVAEFHWLTSVHAYDALTDDFFSRVWPEDWRCLALDPLFSLDHLLLMARDGIVQAEWPESLKRFVGRCRALALPRTVDPTEFAAGLSPSASSGSFAEAEYSAAASASTTSRAGMSRKKLHEVDRFAHVILCAMADAAGGGGGGAAAAAKTIIDVGAGQGYLTHRLAAAYPCVAVDFNDTQTRGSVTRGYNIKRGKLKDGAGKAGGPPAPSLSSDASQCAEPQRFPVVHKTIRITASTLIDLVRSLDAEAGESAREFVLVGLHACGDLSASAMISAFKECSAVRMLAVVPCCFNLLSERDCRDEESGQGHVCESDFGFPMSQQVSNLFKQHKLHFGHKTRNLACQTFDRFDDKGIESNLSGHYKRALLDAMLWYFNLEPPNVSSKSDDNQPQQQQLEQGSPNKKQRKFRLGKLPEEILNAPEFTPYARAALERLGLGDKVTEQQIEEFVQQTRYRNARREVFVVHCVKSLLGRAVESLLLMDRFLALRALDQGVVDVAMLNIFDVDESPRNMVILARKR